VVVERLGHPPETALTLGRFVAGSSAHFTHCCGRCLGPCHAKGFSRLADTASIGGGAQGPWLDNALRHHPAAM
jgi:hypothetical protein